MGCGSCQERCPEICHDKEQKCQIYHILHTLLDKEDDNNFELLFNKFMTNIDNK